MVLMLMQVYLMLMQGLDIPGLVLAYQVVDASSHSDADGTERDALRFASSYEVNENDTPCLIALLHNNPKRVLAVVPVFGASSQ